MFTDLPHFSHLYPALTNACLFVSSENAIIDLLSGVFNNSTVAQPMSKKERAGVATIFWIDY
jgi:hypothetical protein